MTINKDSDKGDNAIPRF